MGHWCVSLPWNKIAPTGFGEAEAEHYKDSVQSPSWTGASKLPICPSRSSDDTQCTCTEDQLPKQTGQGFLEAQSKVGACGGPPGGWDGRRQTGKEAKACGFSGRKVSCILRS